MQNTVRSRSDKIILFAACQFPAKTGGLRKQLIAIVWHSYHGSLFFVLAYSTVQYRSQPGLFSSLPTLLTALKNTKCALNGFFLLHHDPRGKSTAHCWKKLILPRSQSELFQRTVVKIYEFF